MAHDGTDPPPNTQHTLVHQWIVAGMVSAAARLLPIPFLDDIVRERCRRFVVARTLAAHQSLSDVDDYRAYYTTGGGCLSGCLGIAAKVPLKILLFPIRKILALVTSIRNVPLEITHMVLLGRTLDRQLQTHDEKLDPTQAARMRKAFDEAFSRMDLHVIRAAVSDALSGASGWKSAAFALADRVARGSGTEEEAENLPTPSDLESGAEKVEALLNAPETVKLFAEFDARFDEAMRRTIKAEN